MTGIRVIAFDLGRVMIRLAAGWENACRAGGVTYRPIDATPAFTAALDALEQDYGCGRLTPDAYYARLRALVDGRYTLEELRTLHMAIIQPEYPGILELVNALHAAGCATACLSNTCASHWAALVDPARYPAIARLGARHASHLFGLMKPDPHIYRRFEQAMGAQPAEILFFDDGPANVAAARQRGWRAEQITDPDDSLPELCRALVHYGILPAAEANRR